MKFLYDCQITLSLLINIMRFHLNFADFYDVFQKTNIFLILILMPAFWQFNVEVRCYFF